MQLAAPKYSGTKPWLQHPIQWSVHVLQDGEPKHHEFIHSENSDPREAFIISLLDVLGDTGSIIVYSAPFESGRLKEIAETFPQYKEKIDNVFFCTHPPAEIVIAIIKIIDILDRYNFANVAILNVLFSSD